MAQARYRAEMSGLGSMCYRIGLSVTVGDGAVSFRITANTPVSSWRPGSGSNGSAAQMIRG